jgi:hypothetical protein
MVRLSKSLNYLIDNLRITILSTVKTRDQGENGRAVEAVPNWESRAHALAKDAEKDGAPASSAERENDANCCPLE